MNGSYDHSHARTVSYIFICLLAGITFALQLLGAALLIGLQQSGHDILPTREKQAFFEHRESRDFKRVVAWENRYDDKNIFLVRRFCIINILHVYC